MRKLSLIVVFLFIGTIAFSRGYKTITVKKGDTIQKIAKKHLKNANSWTRLLHYNKLKSPRDISPGMKLKIPYSLSSERVARVIFKIGKVDVFSGGKWRSARVGTLVKKNNRVRTGANGKATVKLDDGTSVKISSNSEIALSQYGFQKRGRKSNIRLNKGGMLVKVNKLTRKSKFGISTITAVAGVRGTTFAVRIDEKSKNLSLTVYAGKVDIGKADKKGKVVSVKKGEAVQVSIDKKKKISTISAPVKMTKKLKWIE